MIMRVVLFILICGLLVGAFQTTSKAEVALKPGMKFQNFIRPGETPMQVALPEGEWEVAFLEEFDSSGDTKMIKMCLFQSSGNKLSKFITFVASTEKSFNGGWSESRTCSRDNFHFINSKNNEAGEDQDCRIVNHVVPYWKDSKSEYARNCAEVVFERKLEVPNHVIASQFRLTNDDNLLQVRYYFNPLVEGFEKQPRVKWVLSPWNKTSVDTDSKKRAYVDSIIQWTNTFHSTVKAGFNGSLTGASIKKPAATPPPVVDSPSDSPSAADRLKKLGALLKRDLITKQEYEEKRKAILNSL
jgi:hypothetical protein